MGDIQAVFLALVLGVLRRVDALILVGVFSFDEAVLSRTINFNCFSRAVTRFTSRSCSRRASAAIILTASNSSLGTKSASTIYFSIFWRISVSISPFTPASVETAPLATRARSSKIRLEVCISTYLLTFTPNLIMVRSHSKIKPR